MHESSRPIVRIDAFGMFYSNNIRSETSNVKWKVFKNVRFVALFCSKGQESCDIRRCFALDNRHGAL